LQIIMTSMQYPKIIYACYGVLCALTFIKGSLNTILFDLRCGFGYFVSATICLGTIVFIHKTVSKQIAVVSGPEASSEHCRSRI
jgi:hypothetical protein